MAQRPTLEYTAGSGGEMTATKGTRRNGANKNASSVITRSLSNPISLETTNLGFEIVAECMSNDKSAGIAKEAISPILHRALYTQVSEKQCSDSAVGGSPKQSMSSPPRASLAFPAVSPSIDTSDNYRTTDERNRAVTSLLKSSISMKPSRMQSIRRVSVQTSNFRLPPEQPEKRFVDELGIVFPGVYDRQQCALPRAHFVTSFRLCELTEYTTALADHGVTYADYCRLITALWHFLDQIRKEKKRKKSGMSPVSTPSAETGEANTTSGISPVTGTTRNFWDTTEQLRKNRQEAVALNKLLEEITWNFQSRGVSVLVCVQSFSLFAPSRLSEAHIQILHVNHDQTLQTALDSTPKGKPDPRTGQRLSFIDVFSFARCEQEPQRPTPERQAMSATTTTTDHVGNTNYQRGAQNRDRSKPYPLCPDAIPTHKRSILSASIDRYGVDPYFRAWMRASINSGTQCSTYGEYLIEKERDPFVNKRIKYADATLNRNIVDKMVRDDRTWKDRFPIAINRAKYDHNRKLECRKTAEHGSRLRILRFGFRHPIYPPHTPEMDVLGLSKDLYLSIITSIDRMHTSMRLNTKCPGMYMIASLNSVRRKGTEDAVMKLREYIRRLNASQRTIVWTIEKIPWVYDKGFGRNRTEWEISAWSAEDPLELLMQLERWGLIENRMSLDDED